MGPFPIISRPSNTTVKVRVGYTKSGEAREEVHHWENCRIANLRPNQDVAERPKRGRPSHAEAKTNTDAQNSNSSPVNEAQPTTPTVTQPRTQPGRDRYLFPPNQAKRADSGRNNITPLPHQQPEENVSFSTRQTGPPKTKPFSSTKSSSPAGAGGGEYVSSTSSGQLATPSQSTVPPPPTGQSRQAPLITQEMFDAANWPEILNIPNPPTTTMSPEYSRRSLESLPDHDYYRKPGPTMDHDYFKPPEPEDLPQGRPQRKRNTPVRYNDYQLN